ncbi:GDP-L-fucose synthase family protein [Candidatus Pelagibacter sp. HIMB1695]|uniref:GDP-L-fucose synthase family protein n=1 Tax=Candidatus Pelagibacter sp. HIMB1695 TaxID=3413364 RepID=UPI003F86D1C8
MFSKNAKIFVAGHKGLVGSSIVKKLISLGYKKILKIDKKKLDLRDQNKVLNFFKKQNIDAVINAAGTVGGIAANNKYRAEFIYDNLTIQNNIINACYKNKVKSLIFLGSSSIYPKNTKIPIKEEYLLSGYLEKTNEPYAVAKIAGIKLCESYNYQYGTNYKCLIPCNVYGQNDNYDKQKSHFFPALILKSITAKKKNKKFITLWGSGRARREILHSDDLADACIYFLKKRTKEKIINIGSNFDMTILNYAKLILKEIDYDCEIILDKRKPNGTFRKLLDSSKAKKYGWEPKISLKDGLKSIIKKYS